MTTTTIFLSVLVAALLRALYARVTGKEMFPANPKGPLYRWFGKPNHERLPTRSEQQRHDRLAARLSSPPNQPPASRFRLSKPPR